ncbi:NF038122 family metalloprotease, partial [Bradyrhizobium sp. STM 3843]|uniref:NF038122 family metalloprotease n=1 Tax=Bradyrhizobium sp. STM 3843 TaxID=551947 RepID=UPI001FCC24DA
MSHKPGLLGAQDNSLDGDDGLYVVPSMAAAPENTLPSTPVVIPDEAIEAQAAVSASSSSSGGISSVVSETSGGLTINLIFDAAALAAPASFRAGIQQAAALLSAAISDHITLNFNIDYSGTGGGAAAAPDNGQWMSYSAVRADLVNNASASDATFIALPTGSTIQGQSSVAVWNAQLKLWGLLGANDTSTDDGSATFATDINPNLLVGVALHELTHAMGRVPYGPQPDIFDFYRFTSPGARLFTGGSTALAAYFSLNGGSTKIADYGQSSDASDFLNSGVQGANDPFNEYYTGNTLQQLTSVDLQQLDALGFHLTANTFSTIEALGSTSLVQVGYHYFLNSVASGSGPELTYQGAPVTLGEFGAWTPIGAEAVSGGYDVAWKNTSSGLYIIWNVDGSGNYVKDIINGVSATNAVLESYETTFHQDLNSDGTIGLVGSTIEGLGTTSLMQVGVNYLLNSSAGGTGPELAYQGAPVTS